VDELVHHFGNIRIVNTKTGTSKSENTNAASIACVIIWAGQGKVSHYLAGDSYWEQENPLIDWILQSGQSVGAVKLSHHGSESSSPTNLFGLQPRTVIVSAGTMHGHPREFFLGLNVKARLLNRS
jgi:beta-lactamase superfamily II metal-dependent hydrolase